jgi:ABC-type transport system substrate-binding protein
MIQAIVGMWRNVGIDADIEIYEIAKHFELRMSHKLAPAAFYNWGNAIGDPTTSTGFAMFSKSPHSAWHSDDLDAKIGPLWGEKDEKPSASRAGRTSTATSPSRATSCRCCNTRSRSSTSPISR